MSGTRLWYDSHAASQSGQPAATPIVYSQGFVSPTPEVPMELPISLISDLAIIMIVAGVMTFIFHRLKQPLILGYLIAGIIIGPYTPPFALIENLGILNTIADLGIIMLLFTVGLEFPMDKFRRSLKAYAGIAVIEVVLMFLISYGVGWAMGWPLMDCLFLGMALASSSTVIIAKVLGDMGKLKDLSARLMLGILVVEDLIVVIALASVGTVVDINSSGWTDIAWTGGKMLLFFVGAFGIGLWLVPRLIDSIAHEKHGDVPEHDEVMILMSLGLCFGLAILGHYLGLSIAVGAFLMGIFVASARSAGRVASLTSSIKSMFAAVFFVAMGAFIDITRFGQFLVPALIVTIVMMAGKVAGCGLGTRVFRYDFNTSIRVGLGMGQIGEFALIVVKAGQDLSVTSPFLFPTVGTAVAITAFLTPYMIKLSYRLTPDRENTSHNP
ncbi:MAG: cation:proton antiporter [Dehalococcoidales bacterium]|nr:cation:proton antiporter [Dehalococcoidales bacterium]